MGKSHISTGGVGKMTKKKEKKGNVQVPRVRRKD